MMQVQQRYTRQLCPIVEDSAALRSFNDFQLFKRGHAFQYPRL